MRALLTGASGFIGSRLAIFLAAEGVDVVRINHSALDKGFAGIENIIKDNRPDVVFHLAGTFQAFHASDMLEANCLFAAKLLDAVKASDLDCRIVLMGSAAEYGPVEESAIPIREDQPPRPETLYGITKLSQTMIGLAFAREGMDVVVARPFNVLGVGMSDFLAIPGFARQLRDIKSGKTPAVLKTGNLDTSRDFISVNSCVQALWLLAKAEGASGRIVNICSGKACPIRSIVERMINMAGLSVRMEVDAGRMRRSDPRVNCGDPSLLQSLTGYVPGLTVLVMDEILASLLEL
ncbi:MAG: NAD-dependent epimerase/dehydratase family protein [Syntrophales bacterium]